jgi:DNA polymerase-3 subunit alpha
MMFATLDDLESAVELLVFGKALADCEAALAPDSIVLVRGRVDHKDREKTCIVAQQIDLFEATEADVQAAVEQEAKLRRGPEPLRLRLDATGVAATILSDLKDLLAGFPGESDVVIELSTTVGPRRLRLGSEFRVTRSPGLHAELDALLGEAILREPPAVAAEALGAA